MAIQEFEKTSDGRENHNSSGLRASFGGSSGLSLWAGLLVSARRRSYQEKRTSFGVHAILPLRLHFHLLGMGQEFQALSTVFVDCSLERPRSDMSRSLRSTIVLSFCNDGKL